tara:strand:- start:13 stop:384 length:372 start_codon:yes stop_codon:yes gene_type:complete
MMGINVGGKQIKRGETQVSGEEKKKEEEKIKASDYSCEILLEKTTMDKADDRKLPSDAFNVFYVVEGEDRLDVTRSGKMVNVFDLYYDKYGKDAVRKIDYGHGTVNPSQWGYKQPEKKKRRKG